VVALVVAGVTGRLALMGAESPWELRFTVSPTSGTNRGCCSSSRFPPAGLGEAAAFEAVEQQVQGEGELAVVVAAAQGAAVLRLHTVGRRSGQPRAVVLGYIEDGDRLVTLAMNGWDAADPAWWLNLKARPEATVDLARGGSRRVTAHEATGADRERLWSALHDYAGYGDLDAFATHRGRETAVVVLAPSAPG
jgi:deazaflavin-dependent oxidoreductase (nitroreductase family)